MWRDLCAMGIGFTAAYTSQAILHYLLQPTRLFAVLLITCLLTLLVSTMVYVTAALTARATQPSSRTATDRRSKAPATA